VKIESGELAHGTAVPLIMSAGGRICNVNTLRYLMQKLRQFSAGYLDLGEK
jgi:hypothetical protein